MRYLHSIRTVSLTTAFIFVLSFAALLPILTLSSSKADAATLPAYRYTKTFDTTNGLAVGIAVATDSSGNVFVTGQFNGTVIFDGVGGSDSHTALNGATFVTKYNANGTYGWTRVFYDTTFADISDGSSIAIDSSGNIYITGSFDGTVIFDGLGGSHSITSSQTTTYLTKYNADGSYGWTKTFDTSGGFSLGAGVAVNKNSGVYITGTFEGTVIFDGVGGSHSQTSANHDSFLTDYSSSGTYLWTKTADSSAASSSDSSYGISIDSSGNVYTVGVWARTVIFDGVGGSDSKTNIDADNAYVSKYSPDGTYGWTKVINDTGVSSHSQAVGVATDKNGNVYFTGTFQGPVTFDGVGGSDSKTSTNLTSYIAKYNANGTYGWSRIFDASSATFSTPYSVATDSDGNVYEVGSYLGTVVFDGVGGSDSHTSTTSTMYLTMYDTNGNYGWTKIANVLSGTGPFSESVGVTTDNYGNVYTAGLFKGTVQFDGISGTDSITSANENSFLTSYEAFIPPTPPPSPTDPNAPNTGFGKPNHQSGYEVLGIVVSLAVATDVLFYSIRNYFRSNTSRD